jgi:hypothetical protein
LGIVAGLYKMATLATGGTICVNISSYFPAIDVSIELNPVMFPSG